MAASKLPTSWKRKIMAVCLEPAPAANLGFSLTIFYKTRFTGTELEEMFMMKHYVSATLLLRGLLENIESTVKESRWNVIVCIEWGHSIETNWMLVRNEWLSNWFISSYTMKFCDHGIQETIFVAKLSTVFKCDVLLEPKSHKNTFNIWTQESSFASIVFPVSP